MRQRNTANAHFVSQSYHYYLFVTQTKGCKTLKWHLLVERYLVPCVPLYSLVTSMPLMAFSISSSCPRSNEDPPPERLNMRQLSRSIDLYAAVFSIPPPVLDLDTVAKLLGVSE